MPKKKAITGFSSVYMAEVTTDTAASYVTDSPFALPYAGTMSRSPKESSGEMYYDDELYAEVTEVLGEDVEIKFGEMSLADLAQLGAGTLTDNVIEGDFTPAAKKYSFRCRAGEVEGGATYFKWRLFKVNSVRHGDLKTKSNGTQVAEVIVKGTFSKPAYASAKPWAITQLDDTASNQAACTAFLTAAETLPAA